MNFNQLIKFQKFYFLATSFCINPLFGQNFTIFYEDFDGGLPAEWTLRKALGNDDPTASWQYTLMVQMEIIRLTPLVPHLQKMVG